MAGDYPRAADGQFAFDYVEVGAANAAGAHADQNFVGTRFGYRDFSPFKGLGFGRAGGFEDARMHNNSVVQCRGGTVFCGHIGRFGDCLAA
jgi:hypothetical protein